MTLRVEVYRVSLHGEWDDFVRTSLNGTFLFERNYMDYHADRFEDLSLVVRDDRGSVCCLLPANVEGERLVSHGGLTYGGFVVGRDTRGAALIDVFEATKAFLAAAGIRELVYKPMPHIYHSEPVEADLYALFMHGATLVRRDLGACACPAHVGSFPERVRSSLRKAERADLRVEESQRFEDFWPLLEDTLTNRHNVRPVHSLDEVRLLRARFPKQIHLFLVRRAGEAVAGAVIYETTTVAHAQYAAATEEGRRLGAPSLLISDLLRSRFSHKQWFDYGVSTEQQGLVLNSGLQDFKESFGLRAVVSDVYRLPVE